MGTSVEVEPNLPYSVIVMPIPIDGLGGFLENLEQLKNAFLLYFEENCMTLGNLRVEATYLFYVPSVGEDFALLVG